MNKNALVAKNRRHRQRAKALTLLGGKCVVCGSIERLEFDHINPGEMEFRLSAAWSYGWDKIEKELAKCQLLCKKHHLKKTAKDNSYVLYQHGTNGMYCNHGCRCDKCKLNWSEYQRTLYLRRRHNV